MSGPSPLALAHRLVAELQFSEAAAQFGLAAEQTEDAGAKKTLKALQAQNERKALDVARRQQQQQAEASTDAAATAAAAAAAAAAPSTHHRRSTSPSPTPKPHRHRSRGTSELRKELLTPPPPFAIASSPSSSSTGPAAVSPRGSTSLMRQAAERARTQRHLEISRLDDGGVSVGRDGAGPSRGGGAGGLAESTTWSRGGESSYLFPPRERSDPFQRFWGVVEGMLEDYSNPVAFASAPLGSVLDGRTGRSGTSLRRSVTTPAKLEHSRDPQRAPAEDAHDSFYLVSPQSSTASSFGSLDDFPASAKTPEELQLENMSLRLSLDKLASHTHALEQRLAALSSSPCPPPPNAGSPTNAPTRDSPLTKPDARAALGLGFTPAPAVGESSAPHMAPVDFGRLKKEVEKVWRGEESRVLEMSRVLQAQATGGAGSSSAADQRRIGELERQVSALRDESAKQRETIAKYRERLERIKVGARKKREEREKEDGQPAASGEDVEGEGDG